MSRKLDLTYFVQVGCSVVPTRCVAKVLLKGLQCTREPDKRLNGLPVGRPRATTTIGGPTSSTDAATHDRLSERPAVRKHYTTMHERLFFYILLPVFFIWFTMRSVLLCSRRRGHVRFNGCLTNRWVFIIIIFFRLYIYISNTFTLRLPPTPRAPFHLRPGVDAVSYVPVLSKTRVILSSPSAGPADWGVFFSPLSSV